VALKLSARDQMIAVGLVALLVLVMTVLLILKPQFSSISEIKAEQEKELANLAQAKVKLQRLDAIRQEAADVEAKRISLSRRMPENPELPSLIIELQKIANSAGLDFGSVEVAELANQSGYAEVPISLQVTGTFYSIVDYMYRLEKMDREIVVDSFDLQPTTYPDLQIGIKARVFKVNKQAAIQLPPPAPTPTQGAPAPATP